jgi:trehalose 6-phosphate synthase
MRLLRRNITQEDIFWWVDNFLRTAADKALRDFPESTLPPLFPRGRRTIRQQKAE